jgi:multidrug efflux pump subunit AcrB
VIAIVQVALRRPYTFIVLAIVIALFGIRAALTTPIDIFPAINIPVVSVVWTYSGMLPSDMSGRIVYFYERTLSQQVSNIARIESQSLTGYGVINLYFTPNVTLPAALAQVTAAAQTVLKLLPPGITPPYVLSYRASSVPIVEVELSSKSQAPGKRLFEIALYDLGENFIRPQLAQVQGAAVPAPFGGKVKQIQVDLDEHAMQAHGVSAYDVVNAITMQNLIIPAGTEKMGKFEWNIALNASPIAVSQINHLPVKAVNGTIIYVGDVAYVHIGSFTLSRTLVPTIANYLLASQRQPPEGSRRRIVSPRPAHRPVPGFAGAAWCGRSRDFNRSSNIACSEFAIAIRSF